MDVRSGVPKNDQREEEASFEVGKHSKQSLRVQLAVEIWANDDAFTVHAILFTQHLGYYSICLSGRILPDK